MEPEIAERSSPGAPAADGRSNGAAHGALETVTLPITGMNCAACAARIEKMLRGAPGVEHVNVNFAPHRATVEYDPSAIGTAGLVRTIREAGYGVQEWPPAGDADGGADDEQRAREEE